MLVLRILECTILKLKIVNKFYIDLPISKISILFFLYFLRPLKQYSGTETREIRTRIVADYMLLFQLHALRATIKYKRTIL